MKKIQISIIVVIGLMLSPIISVTAQSFTEIIEYGWGGGVINPKPCIFDIDNDGNLDMLIGAMDGSILHYEQDPENLLNFKMVSVHFNNIIVDEEAAPFLYDIDEDGLVDLLVGNSDDVIHYEQDSPQSYSFSFITDGFVPVGSMPNYLKPVITNIDNDGLADLLVGHGFNEISYYEQVDPGTYDFILATSQFNGIFSEYPGSFCAGYIDDNNLLDILSGSWDGLRQYEQIIPNSIYFQLITYDFENLETGNNPNPFIIDINDDELTDLFVADEYGKTACYEKYLKDYKICTKVSDSIAGIGVTQRATPIIIDIDNDGLLDMLVGSDEIIFHYEQVQSFSWDFSLISDNFNNIEYLNDSYLDCKDINNDGLLDLLIGMHFGTIKYYVQSSPNSYEFNFVTDNFNDIDTYPSARPLFYDLDNDGLLDLITGVYNSDIYHFEQTGPNSLVFAPVVGEITGLVLDEHGGWDISDLNGNNKLDIVVAKNGVLKYLEESSPGSLDFIVIDEHYSDVSGYELCPKFTDIDGDDKLDMLVGEYGGSIIPYEEDTLTNYGLLLSSTSILESIDVGINSSPTICNLNNDGLIDLLIGSKEGRLYYYSQAETGSYEFELVTETFADIYTGEYEFFTPTITDLNGNSKLDLIIGDYDGKLIWYEQSEAGSLDFSLIFNSLGNIDVGSYAAPAFRDLDNDGLLELLIGNEGGTIAYYKQDAPQSYYFSPVNPNFNSIDVGENSAPFISDIDNNGLFDLLVGNKSGVIFHYIQDAQYSLDFSLESNNYGNIEVTEKSKPTLADINNDGYIDLLVGKGSGGLNLYLQENPTQQIPIHQNYSECEFPQYWSQEATATIPFIWSVENTSFAGAGPCEMKALQFDETGTTWLKTPFFYVEDWDNISLEFKHYFEDAGTGLTAKIQWSEDGTNWTDAAWEITSGNGNIGPETVSVDITGFNSNSISIAFVLEGNHNQFLGWYVDDIWCYNVDSPPPSTSPITPVNGGLVYNGASLIWDEVPNANAYRLYFGTDNPPTNIENGLSIVGNLYVPEEYLDEGTSYFWKIVPYNSFGDASGCSVWEFTVRKLNPPVNLFGEAFESHVQLSWEIPFSTLDSLLIIDRDPNNSSGPEIKTTLQDLGYEVTFKTNFPEIIDPYAAIFTCLGIYSSNHILTEGEGQQLADYLNNGGNLYMEGGDTWFYNDPTAVHPMFNINGISDGNGDLNIIMGIDGTPAAGMAFNYNGENNWIDHIAPMGDAYLLLKNDMPEYGVAVVNTNDELYNTIGASFEFGGLVDGTLPSTKETLMIKYLQAFDLFGKNSIDASYKSVLGYNVYRSDDNGSTYSKVNTQPIIETEYVDIAPDIGMYYYYVKAVYEEGVSIPSNIDSVDVIVGVHETETFDISICPNPATDEVMINSAVPILDISLYNTVGDKVYYQPVNNRSIKIPVSKFNQGIYYLKINIGGNIAIKKVIIRR